MVKYCLLIIVLLLNIKQANSQFPQSNCAANQWTKDYMNSADYIREKRSLRELLRSLPNINSIAPGDSIPVVVHVVWSTAAMNIPDSAIYRQIQILNEDFARLNSDTINTPLPFKALAGATPFRFVLARRDPNGAFTTGIIRRQTTHTAFTGFYDLSKTANGGDDAWNGSYLNIYSCELASPAAGVAMLNFSRVAIGYAYWGYSGANKNKVGTHEVGHCFGLQHIWGSETQAPYSCSSDDGILDTPAQYQPSFGCPTFPLLDQCTTSGNGIMFCNYMDYSSGTCQNMFSNGQISAMINNVNTNQSALLTSNGDVPVKQVDAGCSRIISPTGNACNTYKAKIVLRNWGIDTLKSVNINYIVDTNSPLTVSWTGSLSNYQTDTIILPNVICTASVLQRLKVYTSLPNTVIDQDATNDTSRIVFVAQPVVNVPMFEGFEGSSFPLNVGAYNPDADNGFMRSLTVAHSGTASCVIDNGYNISNYNHYDEINIKVNLFNTSNPYLSFYVANTSSAPLGSSDTLELYSSIDCGLTYNRIYRKFDTLLYTAPVIPFGSTFIPLANQWRKDSVELSSYSSVSSEVLLTFRNISAYGLELYLDDIRINNTITGINELNLNENILLYPNPNNGTFHLEMKDQFNSIIITDMLGKVMYSKLTIQNNILELNLTLMRGNYIISLKNNKGTIHKKFLVD